jgi:hypothetical protein
VPHINSFSFASAPAGRPLFGSELKNRLVWCIAGGTILSTRGQRRSVMDGNRSKAMATYERVLVRVALEWREPTAWEEFNLLEALVAMISGDYRAALAFIDAAARPPASVEVAAIGRQYRPLLTWAEIRDRFDELKGARLFHELISSNDLQQGVVAESAKDDRIAAEKRTSIGSPLKATGRRPA